MTTASSRAPVRALLAAALFALLPAGAAFAADPGADAEALAAGERIRSQSLDLIHNLQDVAQLTRNAGMSAMLDHAEAQLRQVPSESYAQLAERTQLDLGPLIHATGKSRDGFLQLALEQKAERDFALTMNSVGLPDPPAVTSICNGVSRNAELRWSLALAEQVAEAAVAAASRGCDEVIVILGEGGNVSLACLPLDIAFAAARSAFQLPAFCDAEDGSALLSSVHDRAGHIHGDLEAARVEILANDDENTAAIIAEGDANRDAIINNDNANRDVIIDNDNTNRELILARIESLREDLRALSCEMIRLDTTPQGQRNSSIAQCAAAPGFPFNFPEK